MQTDQVETSLYFVDAGIPRGSIHLLCNDRLRGLAIRSLARRVEPRSCVQRGQPAL